MNGKKKFLKSLGVAIALLGNDELFSILQYMMKYSKSWLAVQNLRIALSRVFVFFEAFRLTLIKKDRQHDDHRKDRVFIEVFIYVLPKRCNLSNTTLQYEFTQTATFW